METETLSIKKKIGWLISLVVPLVILLIPNNYIFTDNIQIFFAITVFIILWFAFELTTILIPALLLPVLYIISGITTASTAFSPWATNIPWMVLAALLIVIVVERVGLLNRAAYFVLWKSGGGYMQILLSLLLISCIFNLVFSGMTYVIVVPVVYGICKALSLENTKTGAGLMFAGMIAANMPSIIVYNPGWIGMSISIVESTMGLSVSYIECLMHNIVFLPLCFIMLFVISKMYKQDVEFQGKEFFEATYKSFGKMRKEEKKSLGVLIVLLLGLVTSGVHGIALGWIFLLAAVAFFLPGINVGNESDIAKVNFSLVIFMVSCMSIGQVSAELGIGGIIADLVGPIMGQTSPTIFVAITWLLAVVLNVMMTPLAAIATFSLPIAQIALDYGISPLPIFYAFFQGLDQVFLPYEYLNYLFAFAFGLVTTKQFLSFFSVKMLLNIVYLLLIAVPFWMVIGLL